jgi:hypothetical protein
VKAAPAFSNKYIVKGVLYIPYAEIREPFYAWYDSEAGSSRIDYYGGDYITLILIPKNIQKKMFNYVIYKYFDAKLALDI